MHLTARIAPSNLPINNMDKARVTRLLEGAGITQSNGEGIYTAPRGQNLFDSSAAAIEHALTSATLPQNEGTLTNGWRQLRTAQGTYGSNYVMRQSVASAGYMTLQATEALYPYFQTKTS